MTWADGELAALDTETTGVSPDDDVIVSFAIVVKEGGKVRSDHRLVNPGIPIPEDATKIHGITDDMVMAEGMDLTEAVTTIHAALLDFSARRVPLVVCNAPFDLTLVDVLCRELLGTGLVDSGWDGIVLDPLVLDKHVDRYRKGSRQLGALARHYDVPAGDHSARSDALAALRVVVALHDHYKGIRFRTPEELHRLQMDWHAEQVQSLSAHRVDQGETALPTSQFCWPLYGPRTIVAEPTTEV